MAEGCRGITKSEGICIVRIHRNNNCNLCVRHFSGLCEISQAVFLLTINVEQHIFLSNLHIKG